MISKNTIIVALAMFSLVVGIGIGVLPAEKRPTAPRLNDPVNKGASISEDLSDAKKLLGNSHYVFVGKVIKQMGADSDARKAYGIYAPPFDRALISTDQNLSDDQLKTIAEKNERVIALQKAYPDEILSDADVSHNRTYNNYQSLMSGHLFTPPPFAGLNPAEPPANAPDDNPIQLQPQANTSQAEPTVTAEPTIEATLAPEQSVAANPTPAPSDEPTLTPIESPTPTPEPVQS